MSSTDRGSRQLMRRRKIELSCLACFFFLLSVHFSFFLPSFALSVNYFDSNARKDGDLNLRMAGSVSSFWLFVLVVFFRSNLGMEPLRFLSVRTTLHLLSFFSLPSTCLAHIILFSYIINLFLVFFFLLEMITIYSSFWGYILEWFRCSVQKAYYICRRSC